MRKPKVSSSFSNDIFDNFPAERDSWLQSYSDIITLLLCFFILFYYLEKSKDKKETVEKASSLELAMDHLKKELGLRELSIKDLKDVKKMIQNRYGEKELVLSLESLDKIEGTEVLNYNHFVSLEFPKGDMFNKGAVTLNERGLTQLRPVIEKLKKFKDTIVINVVAYADPTPVRSNNTQWWKTNEELSALRALSVQKVFLEKGYSPQSVYISGKGVRTTTPDFNHPTDLNGEVIETSRYNQDRTVSIRLESK